jgi:pyruvate dehydrogenase E1 component
MTAAAPPRPEYLETLQSLQRRVLWLAVRIVDYANHERPKDDALKVGGHQASATSLVSLMTALYFADLDAADRVSVKPHASPTLHAIEYLLGRLDRGYLTQLRSFHGLQPYPSRTKDPFPVDYSTGSVGLGSTAPLFGSLADRYIDTRFGAGTGGRFISLLGDAELDEGSVWEAVAEPLTRALGNVLWIIDLNRQSLDRVIPGKRASAFESVFRALGWNVIELKYGRRLRDAFGSPGGEILRQTLDDMPNEQYQSLFGASDEVVREALLDAAQPSRRDSLRGLLVQHEPALGDLVRDLGGHDLADILEALRAARSARDRPTVIFAYTVKGFGLEIAGRPMNHSALLDAAQIDRLRSECGLTEATEWDRFAPASAEARTCEAAKRRLTREAPLPADRVAVPATLKAGSATTISTQAALGRTILELSRHDDVSERLVTVSPDVSVSTNLGGWINKAGVWAPEDVPSYDPMEDSPLRWRVGRAGRHIELGIAEMNLVMLLGQLGLTAEVEGVRLLPIGTLYDPFVMRALEGIVYSTYSDSRFILVGTPSGISLSREGGAHQSIVTPGLGITIPRLAYAEPCFATEMAWLLLDGLRRLQEPDGTSLYLRLSTTPIDQGPFQSLLDERGEESLRNDVVAGGFRLREAPPDAEDRVIVATCGALVPEALAAADRLSEEEGVETTLLCISSPSRLYESWSTSRRERVHSGRYATKPSHLDHLVAAHERGLPVVTAIDGASHSLAWLGSALGATAVPLGVDAFGQVGSQQELYDAYGISEAAIVTAALHALEPG